MAITRTISATTGTIPNNTALTGTVTTNAVDSKVLDYVGTDDFDALMPEGRLSTTSKIWIYIPSSTEKIARVMGRTQTGTNTWALTLESAITGASADACSFVVEGIGFSFTVTSGTVQVGGVSFASGVGDTYSPYQRYGARPLTKPVLYVDATSGVLLVHEEK